MPRHPGQPPAEAMDATREVGPKLWLWWTLAAVAGLAVGEFLFRASGEFVWGALLFRGAHVLGVGVAVLQALVLRRHLPRAAWWILATGVAAVLGGIAVLAALADVPYLTRGIEVPSIAFIVSSVLASGLLVGASQWLILRRHVARAAWWVPASGLSLTLGWLVGATVAEFALDPRNHPPAFDLLAGLLSATIYGALTGHTLSRLLQSRKSNPRNTQPAPH